MFPLWESTFWQSLAHGGVRAGFGFARPAEFAQDDHKAMANAADGLICDDCYPSPYPWPDPVWVRPFLSGSAGWRRIAYLAQSQSLGFQLPQNKVESAAIKTITRGSVTCGNRPLSSWRFVQPPLRAVCRPPNSAALPARSAAHFWLMRLTKTWSQGRPLAGLPVRYLAVFRACRAATDLTAAQSAALQKPSGPLRLGWLFHGRNADAVVSMTQRHTDVC